MIMIKWEYTWINLLMHFEFYNNQILNLANFLFLKKFLSFEV